MYDDDFYDEEYGDGFACGGRYAYDCNGYTVCDCHLCMAQFRREEGERRAEKIRRETDWSKFPMEITSKVDSKCCTCQTAIAAGTKVIWDGPGTARIHCLPEVCKPKGWKNHPAACKFCGEPYSGESGGWGYDGDYDPVVAHFGCGTTKEYQSYRRSSGCRTITKLRNSEPSNGGVVDLLDLAP